MATDPATDPQPNPQLSPHPDLQRAAQPAAGDGPVTLALRREELHVGTRTVDTGKGVRVHKAVVEHPCVIDETLSHEQVDVKHVPIDKIVSLEEAPASRYEGDTLIVPILEEILVVEKRLRIKEEIHITRIRREQRHSETVLLKSEEVSIERFDEASGTQTK